MRYNLFNLCLNNQFFMPYKDILVLHNHMTKIYCICIDAFPETDNLIRLMKDRNLTRSELICAGAFTCATFTTMISGCIGTEIIESGIGYTTSYKKEFYEWRQNHCIIERLLDNDLSVIINNHIPWFSNIIGGKGITDEEKNKHYRDHKVSDNDMQILPFCVRKDCGKLTHTCTNPDVTLNTFIKWNFLNDKTKFYANEKEYIKYIQKNKFNGLFITDLCHWHEYVYYRKGQVQSDEEINMYDALNNSEEWLANWNFDEPDSVFYVFADHSHRVEAYLDPPSYTTWVYYKDNTKTNTKLNPIIASTDFYRIIENKFNLNKVNKSLYMADPFVNYDVDRIYAVEDGRGNSVNCTVANSFCRCCNFNEFFLSVIKLKDSSNYPEGIYLILTKLSNKHTFTVYFYTDLNNEYSDFYSISCSNSLDDRKLLENEAIYQLTPDIFNKAVELYKLID